ncbi:MAG: DCC1-like thiol-disulfide oxidoreductase family protein [Planctomycetes bacterium]|nr:DCC1-like thiol-disulfide oxidoreductase family protein [Planctomycetota bacterium]
MTAHRTRSAWFCDEASTAHAGWVCYDADCSLCTAAARRFGTVLARRGIETVPLQEDWVRARLGLRVGEASSEMAFIVAGGQAFGGAEAVARICREIGWAWPVWAASRVPGVGALMRAGYRWVAAHRSCAGGACRIQKRSAVATWAPLLLLPASMFAFRETLPAWAWMWTLSAAIFAGCKWATFRLAPRAPLGRSLAYLFLWPGMEAKRFLGDGVPDVPGEGEWAAAIAKTTLGVALFAFAAHLHGLAAGWLAMAALVLALHCGVFHLLSCLWRTAGIDAPPLMNSPLLAKSPSDFWNDRWNRGFSDLARALVLRPLRRRPGFALFAVFAVSGLVHELVISVPVLAGWGLPTAYFLFQGAVLALERSHIGKRLGLGSGWRGRVLAWVAIAGPAFLLFHPAFVRGVILPMLRAAGAH